MNTILDLPADKAKEEFLKKESYVSIDLPQYFDFSTLLNNINTILNGSQLSNFIKDGTKPSYYNNVNYLLYSNKDGKYSWRPLQIINPVIYVELVNILTAERNWEYIQERFKKFHPEGSNIKCASIPVISPPNTKDKARQIMAWWEQIEQESLRLALEFNYVIHADITNCYGSVYTHTISWALHGKEEAKKNRNDLKLLGNKIDKYLQSMNYGQTNGIPQGSVLSDFIAEIILGYIDFKLYEVIKENEIKEYTILRYRDDYRIFTKELDIGEKILKLLSEILLEFNFKLNDKKTRVENDLILSAVKDDKLKFIEINRSDLSIQEELLVLYQFSKIYPNSGSLVKWLSDVYSKIEEKKNGKKLNKENREVLISILTEVMYKNPRVIPVCIAIISIILEDLGDETKSKIIANIQNKFSAIPNIGLLEIWLQRLTGPMKPEYSFSNELCKKVQGIECSIWNIDWLGDGELKNVVQTTDFINRKKLDELKGPIDKNEFDIFSCFFSS